MQKLIWLLIGYGWDYYGNGWSDNQYEYGSYDSYRDGKGGKGYGKGKGSDERWGEHDDWQGNNKRRQSRSPSRDRGPKAAKRQLSAAELEMVRSAIHLKL